MKLVLDTSIAELTNLVRKLRAEGNTDDAVISIEVTTNLAKCEKKPTELPLAKPDFANEHSPGSL